MTTWVLIIGQWWAITGYPSEDACRKAKAESFQVEQKCIPMPKEGLVIGGTK